MTSRPTPAACWASTRNTAATSFTSTPPWAGRTTAGPTPGGNATGGPRTRRPRPGWPPTSSTGSAACFQTEKSPRNYAMKNLSDLVLRARQLATDVFHHEMLYCDEVAKGLTCLYREQNRPLTRAEARAGYRYPRPFADFKPYRLCGSCRTYLYVELAAQCLDHLRRFDEKIREKHHAQQTDARPP